MCIVSNKLLVVSQGQSSGLYKGLRNNYLRQAARLLWHVCVQKAFGYAKTCWIHHRTYLAFASSPRRRNTSYQ